MAQYIFGRNPVQEWLSSELPLKQILLVQDAHGLAVRAIEQIAGQKNIPIKRITRQAIAKIVGHERHQGVAAEVNIPSYVEVDDLLQIAKERQEPPLFAILDSIQDPQNLGAILRTADGAGIHGLIIPKYKAASLTPTAVKTSAGAAVHVPIAQVTNLAQTIDELKESGVWIVGTDQEGDKDYREIDYKEPVAIVLGNEGLGMRRLIREKCDFLATIPMYGKINSLNVSVAAGVMFFEARRHREE